MSQRKVTKRTAPKHAKRNDQYKLTPVGKALATLIAKPEPQRRDPGGGRYIKPLCVSNDGRGGKRIVLVVTHLSTERQRDAMDRMQIFWEIERRLSIEARRAARNAAKGLLP